MSVFLQPLLATAFDAARLEESLITSLSIPSQSVNPVVYAGKVRFPGLKARVAEFACVKNDASVSRILEYVNTKWNLRIPQLILSVTGSAKELNLSNSTKKIFKRGLMKVAESTPSWIITSGYNAGIAKLVGEAIAENTHHAKDKIIAIGVLSLEVVAFRGKLYERDSKKLDPIVYELEKIPDESVEVHLDPNHSHFIFVDDQCGGVFGQETLFRNRLEAEFKKGKWALLDDGAGSLRVKSASLGDSMRRDTHRRASRLSNDYMSTQNSSYSSAGMVAQFEAEQEAEQTKHGVQIIQICVQGDADTLLTIQESLRCQVPILLIAGTRGAADLISNALAATKSKELDMKKLIEDSGLLDKIRRRANYKKVFEQTADRLLNIISPKNHYLLNVYKLIEGDESQDIELSILRSILNARKNNHFENLKLIQQWNRWDIAKSDIFTGDKHFRSEQLHKLLEIALLDNKPEFVKLLIDNGANLNTFATYGRIYYLYNSKKIVTEAKKSPVFEIMRTLYNYNDYGSLINFKKLRSLLKQFTLRDIKLDFVPIDLHFFQTENVELVQRIREYLDDFYEKGEKPNFVTPNLEDMDALSKQTIKFPEQNLFIWSILFNRSEIAKIFWQVGSFQIGNALFASSLFYNMIPYASEKHLLENNSENFANLAIGVLKLYETYQEDELTFEKLLKRIPLFEMNCLEMAYAGGQQKFLASSCVQTLLTKIWIGDLPNKEDRLTNIKLFISCASLGFLAPFLMFDQKLFRNLNPQTTYEIQNDDSSEHDDSFTTRSFSSSDFQPHKPAEKRPSRHNWKQVRTTFHHWKRKLELYIIYYMKFMHSPRIIFIYEAGSFLTFLVLFSVFVLCDLRYYDRDYVSEDANSTNSSQFENSTLTNTTESVIGTELKIHDPSFLEELIIFWQISLIVEEIRQFLMDKTTLKKKAMLYFEDKWNYLDLLGCLLSTVGIIIRYVSLFTSEEVFFVARIILCLSLCAYYLRLLHVSRVYQGLGPKLVMIEKMTKDLFNFTSLFLIFFFAFGVTTEAVYFREVDISGEMLERFVNKAYWPIYGTMLLLEDMQKNEISYDCAGQSKCPEPMGVAYFFLLLMIYMIIIYVLLFNLLIAVFSSTYMKIEENADQIWKYQRYNLVHEYVDVPIFPPPVNYLNFVVAAYQRIRSKCSKRPQKLDKHSLHHDLHGYTHNELFHDEDNDLERRYTSEFLENQEKLAKETIEARLKTNSERLELLEKKFNAMIELFKR